MEDRIMLRNLLRYGSPVLGLAFVFACAPADDADDMEPDEAQEIAPAPEPAEEAPWTTDFQAGPAGTNVTGSLTAEPMGNDTQIRVTLNGLTPGDHAWHIHNAPCGQDGPVVYPFTATADMEGHDDPITAGADGTATATATVPGDRLMRSDLRNGQYSLHVHENDGTDHGPTVACAAF
jgi:Cu/Zn superoxide dismutase